MNDINHYVTYIQYSKRLSMSHPAHRNKVAAQQAKVLDACTSSSPDAATRSLAASVGRRSVGH